MSPRALILEVAARWLYPVMILFSLWILYRGHNEPGGGFIGGLVAVCGTVLVAMAFGSDAARRRLPLRDPVALMSAGVLLAIVSGLPAVVQGRAFLTHAWWKIPLGFTDLKVSTVMAFDGGVYLAVWGGLTGIVLALIDLHAREEDA